MPIRIRRLFVVLFITLVSALLWLYSDWRRFSLTPLTPPEQPFYYVVYSGMNITALARDLYERDLLKKPYYFTTLAKFSGLGTQLKAGEYHLREGMRPRDFLQQIADGDVVMHRLVLLEGWNFKQVMAALQANPKIKQTSRDLSAGEIMRAIGGEAKHPEGLLFPDTYKFTLGLSDIAILRRAYETMHTKLENIWQNRDDDLPYQTAYEALIVASIIEKETALEQERPLVASVIVNRLRKRMRLQVDPTVIYGLGEDFTGALKHSHLRKDSPYNTYKRYGLPPTPIAMPGEASLKAAVHPEKTDYFYFVAKGDGSHQFSKTLEEQTAAIKKYQTSS